MAKSQRDRLLDYIAKAYPSGVTSLALTRDNVVVSEIGYTNPKMVHGALYSLKRSGKISVTGEWGSYIYKVVEESSGSADDVIVPEGITESAVDDEKEQELEEPEEQFAQDDLFLESIAGEPVVKEEELPVDLKLYLTSKERRVYDLLQMLSQTVFDQMRFNEGQLEQFKDDERDDFLRKLIEAGVIVEVGMGGNGLLCYRIVEKFYLGLIGRIEILLPKLADQIENLARELAVQYNDLEELERREKETSDSFKDLAQEHSDLSEERKILEVKLKAADERLVIVEKELEQQMIKTEELGSKKRDLGLKVLRMNELHSCLVKIGNLPEEEQARLRSLLTGE